MRGMSRRITMKHRGYLTNRCYTGSRRTCGRRFPKRCNYHGGRPKQCTGKLAKSKWLNAPTFPSSTWQANKADHLKQAPAPKDDRVPPHLQRADTSHPAWRLRTHTTTAFRRSNNLCHILSRRCKRDYAEVATIRLPARLHYDAEPILHVQSLLLVTSTTERPYRVSPM